jgi:DNA-binding protein HU-beta
VNNREFIQELSKRINSSYDETQELVMSLSKAITDNLSSITPSVSIQSFGSFEIKKKLERVSVNPSTQKRMLIPPKLTLSFRPSPKLKDLFN